MRLAIGLAVTAALFISVAAKAEVVDKSAAGFESRQDVAIAAPRAKLYDALFHPERWWDGAHSFSGDARNLSMDVAKGCFCEALAGGGSVRHMTIVYMDGKTLRLFGGLGPLQTTGAAGHLAFITQDAGAGSKLTMTYDVGGYAKGSLSEAWAAPVDRVLGEQVAHLKKYLETGKP